MRRRSDHFHSPRSKDQISSVLWMRRSSTIHKNEHMIGCGGRSDRGDLQQLEVVEFLLRHASMTTMFNREYF
jgi:hypothetical protein